MLKMSQNAPERRYATTLLTDTAVFLRVCKKMLPPGAIIELKNVPKCVCGRGLTPDPTGGAYSVPQTP